MRTLVIPSGSSSVGPCATDLWLQYLDLNGEPAALSPDDNSVLVMRSGWLALSATDETRVDLYTQADFPGYLLVEYRDGRSSPNMMLAVEQGDGSDLSWAQFEAMRVDSLPDPLPIDRFLPSGGTSGQLLTKVSQGAFDAVWEDPPQLAQSFSTLAELNLIVSDATLDDAADERPPTAHEHVAAAITDASPAGRSVLTAADVAAIRQLLSTSRHSFAPALHDSPRVGDARNFDGVEHRFNGNAWVQVALLQAAAPDQLIDVCIDGFRFSGAVIAQTAGAIALPLDGRTRLANTLTGDIQLSATAIPAIPSAGVSVFVFEQSIPAVVVTTPGDWLWVDGIVELFNTDGGIYRLVLSSDPIGRIWARAEKGAVA